MDKPRLYGDDENGFHFVATWTRKLSANEIKQLNSDPWQLFWRDYKARQVKRGGQSARSRRRRFMWRTATPTAPKG